QLGVQILGVSSLAAGFNFIVTILNLRAPGMTMMRLPVFAWMTLVTQFIVITAFPVLTVVLLLLMFDRLFGAHFFLASAGATPLLWQHLFWIFGHPEVYILILPAMGIVSEVLPTFARKPLFGYTVIVYSGVLIGFMGWGVWSHHMFAVGLGPIAESAFAATTMLIAIPTGVKIFNWIATLWGGDIRGTTALYFAVGWCVLFLISAIRAFLFALSIVACRFNLCRRARPGQVAPKDPWGGATLEWSIASPPPAYNFSVIPTVTSRMPRWKTERHDPIRDPPAVAPVPIHVPPGSWSPLIAALGLPVLALAPLTHTLWLAFLGAAILLVGIYRWAFEPFEA